MKQYRTIIMITLTALAFCVGCAVQPQLSPLQKREITTKLFDSGYENTYRSILTVLQDQGYIIKNTDMNTGLINANIDREAAGGEQFAQALLLGYVANKGSEIDASFMVNKISNTNTEVRINLQESKYGQTSQWSSSGKQSVKQILDPGIYNQLFNEIRTEIKRREAMDGGS